MLSLGHFPEHPCCIKGEKFNVGEYEGVNIGVPVVGVLITLVRPGGYN